MTNNIENTVEEVRSAFADYFAMVKGKKFKQFYYDWHVDNMLAPFAGVVEYFHKNYGMDAKKNFHRFVEDVVQSVDTYNEDKPQLSVLYSQEYIKTGDGRLASLVDGIETFGFELRQFMYSFASKKDHSDEFGNWPIKTNMPYSGKHGLMVGADILHYLDNHFDEITNEGEVYQRALFASDNYLRKNMVKEYQYEEGYTFADRKREIGRLHELRNRISKEYREMSTDNPKMSDLFQVEAKGNTFSDEYWPSGFELEFYVPEEFKDYDLLIDYLKDKNGWEKLYSTNKDASVYLDKNSAGVIMRDESLARHNNLAAVEYASRIMRDKDDEDSCLKILDAFDEGHVNVHCSLHQHLSAEGFDMAIYKRLVKRMMLHEKDIVGAFAAPERRDNNLLYATYISRNLSQNGERDYPFLAIMVDLCDNKKELEEMSAYGNKYKTLNVIPKHTVEMRFMNANFNKKFVEAFLQFNREFVMSAVNNNPNHMNRFLLNKYTWYNNQMTDDKTVMHDLSYYYQVPYDSYRPMKRAVSKSAIEGEQKYSRLVMQALNETGKLPYVNPGYAKKMREVKANAR
ncbi:MAG: hypothetical protein E7017_00685 [Alphaproteobacteria bacterium]|nr:hypothetical protein [Alphaproteobacteria bacterium]